MSARKYPELFPIAMGNEEETMLMTGPDRDNLEDPVDFVAPFGIYLPDSLTYSDVEEPYFVSNGGMLYNGGTSNSKWPVNLERTTPECAGPRELSAYVQANEKLLTTMLGNYARQAAKDGEPRVARAQRRVIDSEGNGRASHDNFELKRPDWAGSFSAGDLPYHALLTYLKTRSFITGAGYAASELHFAQKVAHIQRLEDYGYLNSAFRVANDDDTGARLEIRCNDINISPWAIQARVGGTALFLTALQVPEMSQRLREILPPDADDNQHLGDFRTYNYANMSEEWQLRPGKLTMRSLDFQEQLMELCDEKLGNFVPLDDEYRNLITELRYYCQDFRKVLTGELDFTVLADRSDMAAKFALMKKSAEKAAQYGVSHKIGDFIFRAMDMRYDSIFVTTDRAGRPTTEYGHGYRLRDKAAFRLSLKASETDRAFYLPPDTTRAKIRASLIKTGLVVGCSWNKVSLSFPDANGEDVSLVIPLEKVLMSKKEIDTTIRNHSAFDKP